MIPAISRISFPNGHVSERVFRFRGVDANLCSLIGAAMKNGGSFTIRPASVAEVVANDAARARAVRGEVAR